MDVAPKLYLETISLMTRTKLFELSKTTEELIATETSWESRSDRWESGSSMKTSLDLQWHDRLETLWPAELVSMPSQRYQASISLPTTRLLFWHLMVSGSSLKTRMSPTSCIHSTYKRMPRVLLKLLSGHPSKDGNARRVSSTTSPA